MALASQPESVNNPADLRYEELAFSTLTQPDQVIKDLINSNEPADLQQLEDLIDKGKLTELQVIRQLIYDWSDHSVDISPASSNSPRPPFFLQYEGLRDGDQIGIPGVKRISSKPDSAKEILSRLPSCGVTVADLGMPISGPREQNKILEIIEFITRHNIPIIPAVAGRTHQDDVTAITEVAEFSKRKFGLKPVVYSFVGSSRIRMLAEGQNKWNLGNISNWLSETVSALKRNDSIGKVIVPFEDTYGAHPDDLELLFKTAFETGADGICICDTCSRGYKPEWTRNLIAFIKQNIIDSYPNKIWEIHTHNMLGNAVKNALTAYNEGLINGIHGTLGGVGDLGGNMDLEQLINMSMHMGIIEVDLRLLNQIRHLVDFEFQAREISPEANYFPGSIYAENARLIPTGIHASAFNRLEEIGIHLKRIFEYVYFPISPTSLGLEIRLDIVTPVSGKANVIAFAKRLNKYDDLSPEIILTLLNQAKKKGDPLTDEEFLSHFNNQQVLTDIL